MIIVLSMELWRMIYACILMCIVAASATSFPTSSFTAMCVGESKTFLHDLKSQCPASIPFSSFPIQMDGESFDRAMSSSQEIVYTAVLFYASWCPFSSIFQSRFAALSSMYPQIKHVMIEQSSAMPSVFSRYGIHSVPSLLIVNQTARMKYHGHKDLHSLVNFYKRTTGLDPVVDMSEDKINSSENDQKVLQLWWGSSLKGTFSREPYLVLSVVFVLSRAFLYFFPEIVFRAMALWLAHIPHLNMGVFGESRQLLGRVFQLIDIKRIWSKLKLCKTRNFHKGARNARVWASSLASVSLGESSSTRAFPSRDL
ncbi:5'-adenylylsulfate reductase-like 5 [Olea europaea var. sylvestris]|uniref:5 -adenylylsulfate reductase-like 5 n=1 Tax=Olea europaea subsp. europaea TaxID=158383 RepID=A0A8S0SL50_OLEEU|nr:5'-adenylylsulfate reductase-like 5 [Olea europaea var. sylvestris]CAA2992300.1 5 -adenylylsulfate reductase-like 5 [Olea europaea subsp. europaea]